MQSFDLQGSKVRNLKDLIHICLELKDQDPSRPLKIIYAPQTTLTLLHKEAKNEFYFLKGIVCRSLYFRLEEKDEMMITDQNGKELSLPPEERKALILAMSLNEKGKAELKKGNHKMALVFLLEAMEEYNHCRSELLNTVDNHGNVIFNFLPIAFFRPIKDLLGDPRGPL